MTANWPGLLVPSLVVVRPNEFCTVTFLPPVAAGSNVAGWAVLAAAGLEDASFDCNSGDSLVNGSGFFSVLVHPNETAVAAARPVNRWPNGRWPRSRNCPMSRWPFS